jgi:hypothetical protein
MTKIEYKAQINILGFLLDHLCNGELPEAGRRAIRKLINNLITEKEKCKA